MDVRRVMIAAAFGVIPAVPPAQAADLPMLTASPLSPPDSILSHVYVHVGLAGILVDGAARIDTPAGRFAGATIRIAPQMTAAADIGYRFTPNWAVSVTVGLPPTAIIDGAGTIGGLGKLGSTVDGPTAVTAHYHFTGFGAFRPYIGGGPGYMIAFNTRDAAVSDFQVRSAWGVVGQVGADAMITDHIGAFVDVKKAYLRTDARGNLGLTPISAKVKLDPLILSAGATYAF